MDGPKNVIWRWKPDEKEYDTNDPRRHDDVAEEYAIERDPDVDAGIIEWAKYHGVWSPNPWTSRPVIAKLLAENGIDIPVPRHIRHSFDQKG